MSFVKRNSCGVPVVDGLGLEGIDVEGENVPSVILLRHCRM